MIVCVLTGAEIKKIHLPLYWCVTLAGALVMLFFGLLPWNEFADILLRNTAVNPLKILVLFLSMTMLSVFLDETGFFRYLAVVVLKHAGGSQIKLFVALYLIVSVLTVFTSNDVIILTFTPFVCYFCRDAKIDPLPYLIEEFVAANTFSMMLMIGNPTNIYLSLSAGVSFAAYFSVMWLPTLFGGAAAFFIMFALFFKTLQKRPEPAVKKVPLHKSLAVVGAVHLVLCTLLLAFSEPLSLPMWLIAAVFAVCLCVIVFLRSLIKKEYCVELINTLRRTPWNFVPFLLSMFVIVAALDYNGVTAAFGSILASFSSIPAYGVLSAFFCNLVNNIPMSVFFGTVISRANAGVGAVFATIIGSNAGAFLTPVGALAGIMWTNILKAQNVKMSYLKFMKYGFAVAVPTLAAALFGLWITV